MQRSLSAGALVEERKRWADAVRRDRLATEREREEIIVDQCR
jgi:hypothetical protein